MSGSVDKSLIVWQVSEDKVSPNTQRKENTFGFVFSLLVLVLGRFETDTLCVIALTFFQKYLLLVIENARAVW